MACSVTIQNVSGTAQSSGSTLHVTVVASDCKTLRIVGKCAAGAFSQLFSLTGAASETFTADLNVRCPCGSDAVITASCVDPNTLQVLPGCTSDTYQGLIICGEDCCIPPQITYEAGACDANNQQLVTFTTSWTIPATLPAACFPILGQLIFGSGTSAGLIQFMGGPGTYSFTDTFSYPAATATTYQAQFVYTMPSCAPVPVEVSVGPCAPADCCPQITGVTIVPGDCQSDCKRAVTITTEFAPPAGGCLAEALQWHFLDKDGNAITNVSSNAFLTSGAAPNVQSFVFDPALSPITAELTGLQYPDCAASVHIIDVKPCDEPPACPVIHTFSANVLGCENVGGNCLRRVEFTIDADFAAGCGVNAGTKIEIDFGDGDQTQLQFNTSGHHTATVSHHYSGNTYNATLTSLNPAPCPGQLIHVVVPPCAPGDCNMDPPCPELEPPPAWCLCKLCYIFSQKPNKGWCKPCLMLIALWISMVIYAAFMGWTQFVTPAAGQPWTWVLILQNIGAGVSLIGTASLVLWYSNRCGYCCLACAVLLGMIIAIIAVVITLIASQGAAAAFSWWGFAFAMIGAFIVWALAEAFCKSQEEDHLNSDTWCQD